MLALLRILVLRPGMALLVVAGLLSLLSFAVLWVGVVH